MSRIGCLVHLQKQIPKYNHNYLSVLVNRSFYYVSAELSHPEPEPSWYINHTKHDVNYIKALFTQNYIECEICIDGCRLRIGYTKTTIRISVILGANFVIYWIKNNVIDYKTHDWIDNRFLTTDRSVIISLFRANGF